MAELDLSVEKSMNISQSSKKDTFDNSSLAEDTFYNLPPK